MCLLSSNCTYRNPCPQNLLEVKRMFVRYVSHEIRTPLSAVVLGLNYLKKQSESNNSTMDQDTVDVVEEVRMSCEAAVDILNDLLTYEKLDGGLLQTYFKHEPAFEFIQNATKPFKLQVFFIRIKIYLFFNHILS